MKLIDILVRELPKRGGWPEGIEEIWQDYDGLIRPGAFGWNHDQIAEDHRRKHEDAHVKINRKQYEAALAASKPQWDGEGLPPVGCECEALYDSGRNEWFLAKIIGHDNGAVIGRWLEGSGVYSLFDYSLPYGSFRPIRSEADKKKEAAIFAIAELCRESASNGHSAELIYDAIKSGKIVID